MLGKSDGHSERYCSGTFYFSKLPTIKNKKDMSVFADLIGL